VSSAAAGSISALPGSFNSEFADVNSGNGVVNVHNVPLEACLA
jgi:hypothetical protein